MLKSIHNTTMVNCWKFREVVNILYRKEHFIFFFRWLFFPIESSNTFQYLLLTSLKAFSNSDRLIVWSLSKLCFFNTWKWSQGLLTLLSFVHRFHYNHILQDKYSLTEQGVPIAIFFKIKRLIITYELFMTIPIWESYLKTKLDSTKVNQKKFNCQI